MKVSPLFHHGLFGVNADYFVKAFRKGASDYRCIQDPLAEPLFEAAATPKAWLALRPDQFFPYPESLVHDAPWYAELSGLFEAWAGAKSEQMIHDGFFGSEKAGADCVPLFRALLNEIKGVPVLQGAYTVCRIGRMRDKLGGRHLFYWRNPRDFWTLCQGDKRLDGALAKIVDANDAPAFVRQAAQLAGEATMRSPADSYRRYYTVWAYSFLEGHRHADFCLSLEDFHAQKRCREDLRTFLEDSGYQVPAFGPHNLVRPAIDLQDEKFFAVAEEAVQAIFHKAGFCDLEEIRQLQRAATSLPPVPSRPTEKALSYLADSKGRVLRHVSAGPRGGQGRVHLAAAAGDQGREPVDQQVTVNVSDLTALHAQLGTLSERNSQLQNALASQQQDHNRLHEELRDTLRQVEHARHHEAMTFTSRTDELRGEVETLKRTLKDMAASTSWRVTAPIRFMIGAARKPIQTARWMKGRLVIHFVHWVAADGNRVHKVRKYRRIYEGVERVAAIHKIKIRQSPMDNLIVEADPENLAFWEARIGVPFYQRQGS